MAWMPAFPGIFMKNARSLAAAFIFPLCAASVLGADSAGYKPELFESVRLVYEDSFDGALNTEFWEVRQSSTWKVADGGLTGSQSSKEVQEKKIAEGDKAHAGFKPVIWLKQVPENFVCVMRMRYDAEAWQPRFPLLDIGHHIHTLVFSEKQTTLAIKKNAEIVAVESPLFSLNEWHDVAIEVRKGRLLLVIDGKKRLFESPHIDMTGHAQIDFKGVDFGACRIDRIQLWEGR